MHFSIFVEIEYLTVKASIFSPTRGRDRLIFGRVTAKQNGNFPLRGNFPIFCSLVRKNCRKTRSIPAVFDNPVSQRLVQAAEVLKCYQPVNCKLDLRFTTLSNGPPASLRILTALNNQSASAPRQNFRHPKTLETTHTTHSLRLSRLLSRAPRSMRMTVLTRKPI